MRTGAHEGTEVLDEALATQMTFSSSVLVHTYATLATCDNCPDIYGLVFVHPVSVIKYAFNIFC